MRLFLIRPRGRGTEHTLLSVTLLAIMLIEREDVPGVFFRRISSTAICYVLISVRVSLTAKPSIDGYLMNFYLTATRFQALEAS